MKQRKSFTREELAIAKSVDLTEVARNLGYTVKRVGSYFTLKEIDSLRIYIVAQLSRQKSKIFIMN